MFPSLHNPFSKKIKTSEEIVLKKNIECLVLLGDNVLDNFCGLKTPNKDIEYQIVDTLHRTLHSKNKGKNQQKESDKEQDQKQDDQNAADHHQSDLIHIHNLSLHGLGIDGLLSGMSPDPQHVALRLKCRLSPYPVNDDGAEDDDKMYPLELLSAMVAASEIKVAAKSKDKHHINPTVVLSVGFVDLVRNLKYGKPELIIEALRKEHFAANLEKIVRRIVDALNLNLIIVWSTYFIFIFFVIFFCVFGIWKHSVSRSLSPRKRRFLMF